MDPASVRYRGIFHRYPAERIAQILGFFEIFLFEI